MTATLKTFEEILTEDREAARDDLVEVPPETREGVYGAVAQARAWGIFTPVAVFVGPPQGGRAPILRASLGAGMSVTMETKPTGAPPQANGENRFGTLRHADSVGCAVLVKTPCQWLNLVRYHAALCGVDPDALDEIDLVRPKAKRTWTVRS